MRRRTRPHPLGVALRGVAMGAADLVPGVSGGTMALITGIYPRLIAALGALTERPTLEALLAGRFAVAWRRVDGGFLATLALGIGTAIVGLARLLHWLLDAFPVGVYAVFFGLIAASAWVVVRQIRGPRRVALAWAAIGAVSAFVLVGATPSVTPDTPAVLAGSGALAVSALLLPGVSGAFVLVLLGKYDTVLAALARFDLATLFPFALGLVAGLLAFSRVLSAALTRWPTAVLGLLAGFLLGSLRKVWPWQRLEGPTSVAVAPPGAGELAVGVALALAAAGVVALLERLAVDPTAASRSGDEPGPADAERRSS